MQISQVINITHVNLTSLIKYNYGVDRKDAIFIMIVAL